MAKANDTMSVTVTEISLRDHFAAAALAGLLAKDATGEGGFSLIKYRHDSEGANHPCIVDQAILVDLALALGDAMVKEIARREEVQAIDALKKGRP